VQRSEFRILAVDDDEIVREMLVTLLSDEGYAVVPASDGLEAIRLLSLEDFQLVLTDYRMPGADGIEVLQKALRSNPDIAVIILTAYATLDAVLKAMREGAYGYLTKPFRIQEVIIAVESAFKRAELISDNRELTRHLRDTFREMEIIKTVAGCNNPEIITNWIERVERLREANVLTASEADILRERLVKGPEKTS
jgi:two-component system response regulator AtoC